MHTESTPFGTTHGLDAEYAFGRPKLYLAPHELARLAILRSQLGDTHAERLARAASAQATPEFPSAHRPPLG